ncbi:glycan metabolism protein RagB [Salegentibacter sp. T436]|nr:glycan metabolism protein RagB [Salegentibacter sp. T436]
MKMKFKYYLGLAAAALTMVGCSEEFLDTEPTEFVSSSQIAEYSEANPGLQAANVSGIYATMYETGTGGTTGHDDYGQKGYDLYSDMLSSDVVLAGLTYGWYSDISRMQVTQDYTIQDNYQVWRYYYRIVFAANNVIDGLGGNDAMPESEAGKLYLGQAKAMRAYAYFYLSQFFAEEYDPAQPILPIYTEPVTEAKGLSTTSEVFDLMISDLNQAIELLDGSSVAALQEVDKAVAQGLLAYVYGAMGEYEEVQTITEDVINTSGHSILSAEEVVYDMETGTGGGGLNTVNNNSWMWGVDLTSDQGLNLISWWGQFDIFTYSYAYVGDPKSIDLGLYNAIPDNDVRKNQFQVVDGFGENHPLPINKFYATGRTLGGQRYIDTDYVYMRIEEMYLLHAEAAAKNGDEESAKDALTTLLSERMDDVSYLDGLSGQALEDEVYLQTRIELWGEGKSYLAMKRNKATITRASNHLTDAGAEIPYNDDRLTFEIPLSEIQNNPNINEQ